MAEQLQLEMGNIRISNDVVSKIAVWLPWRLRELQPCLVACQKAGRNV